MRKLIITALLVSVSLVSFGSVTLAQTTDKDYEKAKACYDELKKDSQKAGLTDNWKTCIEQFKNAADNGSDKAPLALYSAARLTNELHGRTKDTSSAEEAIHFYNEVVRLYPQDKLADDALYQIGLLRMKPMNDNERARRAFSAIIERYPNGDMAPKAKEAIGSMAKTTSEPAQKSPPAGERFAFSRLKKMDVAVSDNYVSASLTLDRPTPFTKKFVEMGRRTKSPAKLLINFPKTKLDPSVPREKDVASILLKSVNLKEGILTGGLTASFILAENTDYDIVQQKGETIVRFFEKGKKPQVKEQKKNAIRIVLDPGHGGEDKDAVGPTGIREKDVALSLAKKTAEALKKKLLADVFLTRAEDKKVSLEDRNKFANSKNADLFISIHANAHKSGDVSGIETFYLNNATDEAAERLAKRENQSAAKPEGEVERILLTMFQNYNAEESRLLAENVQASIVTRLSKRYPQVNDRHVRTALFYVLVGAKCPGILVESSYISNKMEEKRLANPTYQAHIAEGIAEGVAAYLKSAREDVL